MTDEQIYKSVKWVLQASGKSITKYAPSIIDAMCDAMRESLSSELDDPPENLVILPDGRMTSRDAAKYMGFAEKTLAMYRCRGIGPAFIKRGKIFYKKSDIDEWLEKGKKNG